jgi:hypothetical protein
MQYLGIKFLDLIRKNPHHHRMNNSQPPQYEKIEGLKACLEKIVVVVEEEHCPQADQPPAPSKLVILNRVAG